MLAYGWHMLNARIGGTVSLPTAGVFSDLVGNLNREPPDDRYAELFSGYGSEGTVLGGPNLFLHYNRTYHTLKFSGVNHWSWLELFVSESELRSAASNRVLPDDFPRSRGALHIVSLAIEAFVVLFMAALVYCTISVFWPIRKNLG